MKNTEPTKFKYTGYYRVKSVSEGIGYSLAAVELKSQPWDGHKSSSASMIVLDAGISELQHLTFNRIVKVKVEVTVE